MAAPSTPEPRAPTEPTRVGSGPRSRSWSSAALALRVVYVFVYRRDFDPHGDAFFYHAGANLLADGKGFISPFFVPAGLHRAAAEHPPLYIVFLAIPSVLGMKSVLTHLLWSCVLGAATVWLVGLLGRAVGGARVGIIAAVHRGAVPEPLGARRHAPGRDALDVRGGRHAAARVPLLAAPELARGSCSSASACALGALARSELILLVPLLVVPLAWSHARSIVAGAAALARRVGARRRDRASRRGRSTTPPASCTRCCSSAQIDPLLASANCDSTYYGELQGYFDIQCAAAIAKKHGHDAAATTSRRKTSSTGARRSTYVRGHLSRLPASRACGCCASSGLYKTALYVRADAYIEGRSPVWISWAALYSFWVLALLSIAGAVVRRRATRSRDRDRPAVVPAARADRRGVRDRAWSRTRAHAVPHHRRTVVRGARRGRDRRRDRPHRLASAPLAFGDPRIVGTCRRV